MSGIAFVIFARITQHAEEPLCCQGWVDGAHRGAFEGKRGAIVGAAPFLPSAPSRDGLEGAADTEVLI